MNFFPTISSGNFTYSEEAVGSGECWRSAGPGTRGQNKRNKKVWWLDH